MSEMSVQQRTKVAHDGVDARERGSGQDGGVVEPVASIQSASCARNRLSLHRAR